MTFNKKIIGAFALVVCMMVLAFIPMTEDSEAAKSDEFAAKFNSYAVDVLGTGDVVSAAGNDTSVTITLNTSSAAIEAMDLNLDQVYAKFKTKFAGDTVAVYDNYGEGGAQRSTITIINNGELTNVMDLGIRIAQKVKDAMLASQSSATYDGTIIINGSEYKFTFTVNICDELKTIGNRMFTTGPFDITANYTNGKFTSLGLGVTMDQSLYDVIGLSQAELKDAKVADVVKKFSEEGALAKLVEDGSERTYIDLICNEINTANNLSGFIADSMKFTVDGTDIAFTAPTVSTQLGFRGLMETIYNAMSTNFTMTVGSYVTNTNAGALYFKDMGIKLISGQTQTFGTLTVSPVITYGDYVNITSDAVAGATITINGVAAPDNVLFGDTITIAITVDNPSYAITSVKYVVGNVEVKDLENAASQTTVVPFSEGAHKIVVTLNQTTYTVTWKNYDGTVLETDENQAYGIEPHYDGATPVKAETEKYTYEFAGWEPELEPVTCDVIYTAVFTEITKPVQAETSVDFISDTEEEAVTAKVTDIKDSGKDTVIMGKDSQSADILNWTVEMPASVFDNKEGNVSITMKDLSGNPPAEIPDKVSEMMIISIDMTINSEGVHQIGQKVIVKVPYTPKSGEDTSKLVVYYIKDNGGLEKYDATYEDGIVTFETDHFSYWAIGEEISFAMKNSNLLVSILLISAIVLPIIAALVIYKRQ